MLVFLVATTGVLIGYFFKRIVLLVVTGVVGLLMAGAAWMLLTQNLEMAALIPLVIIGFGLWLIVPMWLSHLVRCAHRGGWWQKIKEQTLN